MASRGPLLSSFSKYLFNNLEKGFEQYLDKGKSARKS